MATATPLSMAFKFLKLEGETASKFAQQWKNLTDKDKDELTEGFRNGSLTY